MRRVGRNSFTEVYFAGCNPSFVETSDGYVMIDSPQQPIDAVRWREQLEEKAPIRYLVNTEPHGDHISGNAYFPKVPVVGQVKLQECFDQYLNAFGSIDEKRERFKQTDPDSVWLVGHPDYPPSHGPSLTFTDALTLNVGNHTFNIIHMPGHTPGSIAVHVPAVDALFIGDTMTTRNVLTGVTGPKPAPFTLEPKQAMSSLARLGEVDATWVLPGHGPAWNGGVAEAVRLTLEAAAQ